MKQLLLLCFGTVFCLSTLFANPGDTIRIQSHNETHMNWNGNFLDTTNFPDSGSYRKILMHYVMGCPSGGCSQWDYTTRIDLRDSINDSTFIAYELTRIITPYAGNKGNGWYHEYIIDVTDYAPLLKGKKVINARYDGWQDGFTVSVFFDFIEGTPARDPLSVESIYRGSFKYGHASDPIETHLSPKDININQNAKSANFRLVATGHGFGNNSSNGNPDNCAEFCAKWFKVLVDGQEKYTNTVWKDDCGSEPVFPQTGTWIYNRAGWCPGSEAMIFDHDLTKFVTAGNTHKLDVNWQNYVYTGGSGFPINYRIEAHLFQYGKANFHYDAEIYDILNPTDYDRYARRNPGCHAPKVVIRNGGSEPLTGCKIMYYVEGGKPFFINWTGNLKFLEKETVELPIPPENFFKGSKSKFIVKVVQFNDQNPLNDQMTSTFKSPDKMGGKFKLTVRTNNRPQENSYTLVDGSGNTIVSKNNLTANKDYEDVLDLQPGCYTFRINDTKGDGLYFWADQNQGSGKIQLSNIGVPNSGPTFLKILPAEFGNFQEYHFTVGYNLTDGNPNYSDPNWSPANGGNDTSLISSIKIDDGFDRSFNAYPNPATDEVTLAIKGYHGNFTLSVINQLGSVVIEDKVAVNGANFKTYDVSQLSAGVYYITMENKDERVTQKLVIK